ncbi:uncharacterized protein LOC102206264 [Pundamilia nyererei]|uniref:Uncharacterized protein LOC102206264 n=1 Tax=Pundamilia nyererei TaxID=303518 RepID=A0A9Y6MC45_9CICH|nr:PREDICTED: uncharacterized protein LOC102206264 [Pundamilia nyererei]
MTNTTSKEFKETADEIVAALDEVYKGQDGYSGSIVLKLLPSASRMLRAPPGIIAVLQIIFKASSEIKEDDVIKELENNTCDNCLLSGATFEPTDLCAENPCDVKTSNCTSQDGAYSCTCLEKHFQTDFSDRMCTACPSGSRFKDNTCVKDELYSDQNNTNSQAQRQNNLYAVKRPQIKLHAQSQGYDNPYYQYDSESDFS